jgi:hypothetical protein
MVHEVASGRWKEPGVAPPEIVGRREECYEGVLRHLHERGVNIFHHMEELD